MHRHDERYSYFHPARMLFLILAGKPAKKRRCACFAPNNPVTADIDYNKMKILFLTLECAKPYFSGNGKLQVLLAFLLENQKSVKRATTTSNIVIILII